MGNVFCKIAELRNIRFTVKKILSDLDSEAQSKIIESLIKKEKVLIELKDLSLALNNANVHSWLDFIFGSDRLVASIIIAHQANITTPQHIELINYLIRFGQLLLNKARIPFFGEAEVISIKYLLDHDSKFDLTIAIPQIQFIAARLFILAFNETANFFAWMSENQPSEENQIELFKRLEERVIKVIQRDVAGGKSTIPVLSEAHTKGIPFIHLGAGIYQIGWGSKARRLDRSTSEMDSAMGLRLTKNKFITANLLRFAGLPAPEHSIANSEAQALAAANQIGYPLVIKPIDLERGEGVTVDVVNSEMLKSAFARALNLSKSKRVIVERQVTGICHRLFIANDSLLYCVKRLPMSVIGDGVKTIQQLVNDEIATQKQKMPWSRSEIKPIDEQAIHALKKAGYSTETIPPSGVLVPLRLIETTADGGLDEDMTQIIHPENISVAIAATKLFGLHIAGVDIISADITQPWYQNGAIINEVNYAPLFGGGDISKSYIASFFEKFISGNGKIPLEFAEDEEQAKLRQSYHLDNHLRCFITSATLTLDHAGHVLNMPLKHTHERLKALLLRPEVDAVIIFN